MSKKEIKTVKQFLKSSSSSKVMAEAFINAHRQFLESGELVSLTAPITAKFDLRHMEMTSDNSPTSILSQLRQALHNHQLQLESKPKNKKRSGDHNYLVMVYDKNHKVLTTIKNNEEKELISYFTHYNDADHWAQNRLLDAPPGAYSKLYYLKVVDSDGKPVASEYKRDQVQARIDLLKRLQPASKTVGKPSTPHWKMRAKHSHCSFSRG